VTKSMVSFGPRMFRSVNLNRKSVLPDHGEHLKVGTAARYTQEIGDKGLEASIVEPVEIRGAAEMRGSLYDWVIESKERQHWIRN